MARQKVSHFCQTFLGFCKQNLSFFNGSELQWDLQTKCAFQFALFFFQIWRVKYSVCGPLVGYLKEVALIKGNSAEFTLLMVHKHRASPDRDLKRLKVDAWSVMSRECGLEVGNKGGEVGTVGFQLCSIFKHRASTRFVRIHPRWEARSRGGQQLESGSFVNIYMKLL